MNFFSPSDPHLIRWCLEGVAALLEDPARWTVNQFAKTRYGAPICETHPDARKWCLLGAVNLASNRALWSGLVNDYGRRALRSMLHQRLRNHLPEQCGDSLTQLADYNDFHSHADVLALVREAV